MHFICTDDEMQARIYKLSRDGNFVRLNKIYYGRPCLSYRSWDVGNAGWSLFDCRPPGSGVIHRL